ncbi:MAG: hypothetical protein J6M53_09885 [Bacteroidaceae bacterium]|nr:hypothetical protein [Bacteroidaceae bacterium]
MEETKKAAAGRISLSVATELRAVAPRFVGGALECDCPAAAAATPQPLWDLIEAEAVQLRAHYDTLSVRERKGIRETREAYRAAGLDPSRYRPSCEQLARRLLQGKDLFRVGLAVDLGNLVSLRTGCSVGVIDADRVGGSEASLGLGRDEEPYEAIGRGSLHILNMPVYRDALGAFATPTSDSMRTRITPDTRRLLILINGYHGDRAAVEEALAYTASLLRQFAAVDSVACTLF